MIDEYEVNVNVDKPSHNNVELSKSVIASMSKDATFDDMIDHDLDNPNIIEMYIHNSDIHKKQQKYPVYVVSPATQIIWLYLLKPFRDIIDFNFQRPKNWTDDTPALRFNDCWYLTCHNILDWHDFALLQNKSFLHKGIIVEDSNGIRSVVVDIEYNISDHILNAKSRGDFRKQKQQNFWKHKTVLKYRSMKEYDDCYILSNTIREFELEATDALLVVKPTDMHKPIRNSNGENIEINIPLQHPHVRDGKEFFFTILGMDEYHHTTFSGKRDWKSHGMYWWFANMSPHVQFTTALTMTMSQAPSAVPIPITGKIMYWHWTKLMKDGMLLWTGQELKRRYAMVSHQITDMKERDYFLRRRGNNKTSRCDGALYLGYYHGCKWPIGVTDLMQLGIIMPGPYLLKLWKFVNIDCVPRLWERFPVNYGQSTTLTTCTSDIYNRLPLASSLKSTIELNHTVLMGCLIRAFKIEWYNAHKKQNCKASLTRLALKCNLAQSFDKINGVSSILMRGNAKINVFNQMNQSWQKMIEILIALPATLGWLGNIALLCSFIRVIGVLFTVQSENERQRVQRILIPILQAS